MEYFDIAETWSVDEIRACQLERLKKLMDHVKKSPFYGNKFANISSEDLKTVDDVRKLPFTTKDDLRNSYPYAMLCIPHDEVVRMHCSSGTTGTPVAIHHNKADLDSWASLMARSMFMTGLRKSDVFQNMSGYGLFTGGLGIHYGAEHLGCLTIPAGAGNSRRQIKLIKDFGVSGVHILPSYALHIAEQMRLEGEDPKELPLRIALVGAEPYTEETRKRIEESLGLKVFNSFGLSEMNGPGVGMECECQDGMHIWEDAYILEIINPDTLEPVPDGEIGELVMTSLCRSAMPIIRYRTRDLSRIIIGECACGRKHRRIDRILGRSDDMLIIKGVNIYPMQIEEVLMATQEVGQNYIIQIEKRGLLEDLIVKVELRDEYFVEDLRVLNSIKANLSKRLCDEILITPKIELVQSNSLPISEGKAKRVVDLR